jgi:NAD(P)-dependent dehydrogenase (short-subunit alcohol dehydrogenase family)
MPFVLLAEVPETTPVEKLSPLLKPESLRAWELYAAGAFRWILARGDKRDVVALADVNAQVVRSAAAALVSAGHQAMTIRCNMAGEAEVAAMVARSVASFGRLDAAFNNAGMQYPAAKEVFEKRH